MEKIAKWLTFYIAKNMSLEKEDEEVYCYGFQIGLEVILNTVISIFLSISIGMFWQCILFFLFFIPLRSYAGGVHAKKYSTCLFASCLSLVTILLFVKYSMIPWQFLFVISFGCWGMLWFFSPVEGENRTLDRRERIYYRKRVKCYISLFIMLEAGFLFYQKNQFVMILTLAAVEVCLSQILELIRRRISIDKDISNIYQ